MSSLRREDGMTLPELLIAIIIAVIVSLAAFSLIEVVMRRTAETQGRVEASQKGRAAMDTITRQLRSQVCLSSSIPPMAAADGNVVSFYVDLSAGTAPVLPPELHTITYSPAARTLVERDYVGTGTAPAITYPVAGSPSRVRTLAENVVPIPTSQIFQYYAYNGATPPRPATLLTAPLSTTNLGLVARIEIAFRTLPPNALSTTARGSIVLQDEVYVRAADPNDPAPTPTCA
jgi:prepilin-type N-terminal cleavage/methylation domain-containing protein